jgi:MSHA biogenesis protein MshI
MDWDGYGMLGKLKKKRIVHSTVGIDVQSDGIAVAVVRQSAKSLSQQLSCEFLPCDKPADFAPVMTRLIQKRDLRGQPAVLVLPPGDYNLLQTSTPMLSPAEMRAAAGWKIGELLDFPVEQAVVDVF